MFSSGLHPFTAVCTNLYILTHTHTPDMYAWMLTPICTHKYTLLSHTSRNAHISKYSYAYIHMYTCTHMFVYTYTQTHMYTYKHIQTHPFTSTHTIHAHTCTYTHKHVKPCICKHRHKLFNGLNIFFIVSNITKHWIQFYWIKYFSLRVLSFHE